MRKYKCNPPKPGWYLVWFEGAELAFHALGELYECNAFYWTGEVWRDHTGVPSPIFIQVFPCMDRWSYLPKNHPKKEKVSSRKKVDLYI